MSRPRLDNPLIACDVCGLLVRADSLTSTPRSGRLECPSCSRRETLALLWVELVRGRLATDAMRSYFGADYRAAAARISPIRLDLPGDSVW